jgi:hypothetical protein
VSIPEEDLARKLKIAGMGETVTERLKGMDQFTSALFLPHTDLKAFPSVDPNVETFG